jgi:modulator of FtsH protease HflK
MPWNDGGTGGDGQGPHGPWSRGPSGGGAPDLEELLRRGQERLRRILVPGIKFTRTHAIAIALAAVVVWLCSGVYFVASHEQGFVMRFGKVVAHSSQGMNYRLPWPIETDKVVEVMGGNQLSIGTQAGSADASDATQQRIDYPAESLMLTGDGNIVDVNFTVMWSVKDASAYLFNVDGTDKTIKAVAESAMREVIGQSAFDAINPNRETIERRVRLMMQKTLDDYGAGIAVTSVQLGNASAPEQVDKADRSVQAAQTVQTEKRGDAETYANKVIPEARGDAARIVQEAQAYRQQAIAEAGGEAKQFLAVYEQYKKAPEVTRRRMYLETMSKVLAPMNKIILDGHGAVTYLPLPDLQKSKSENVTMTPPPRGSKQNTAGPRP